MLGHAKIKISQKQIIITTISIGLIIFTYLLGYIEMGSESKFKFFTVYGVVIFSWIVYSWWLIKKNIISIYMFFMLFSILFYWGQPVAFMIGADSNSLKVYSILSYPYGIINKTLIFILVCYLLIHIGGVLFSGNKKTNSKKIECADYTNAMNSIGIVLLAISLIPMGYLIVNSIRIVMFNGYVGLFTSSTSSIAVNGGLIGVLSGFFVPGLYLLLISNASKHLLFKMYSSIFLLYIIIIFLLGRRGENTIYLLGYLLIYHNLIKPIKGKGIFKLFLLGIVFLFILSIISNIRAYLNTDSVLNLIVKSITEVTFGEQIRDILAEFGITLLVPITILDKVPNILPFYNGKSYLNFFLVLLPNMFWDNNPGLADGTLESIVSPFVRSGSVGGIGGSFLAELYYNFGYYCYILLPVFGCFLVKLNEILDFNIIKIDKLKFFFALYVFTNIIWIIRSEIMTSGKEILYFAVIPVILVKILNNLRKKSGVK